MRLAARARAAVRVPPEPGQVRRRPARSGPFSKAAIDAGTAGMVYVVGRPEQAAELVRSMTDKIGHANNTPFCGMFGPRQIFSPGSGSAAEAEAAADANTLAMQITIFKKKEK